jgi:CRISPR-associated protein Cas2
MTRYTLVIYDIPDDGLRLRIMNICKDFGLDHIQYSAFLGPLPGAVRKELIARLKREMGRSEGNIQIFPICEVDISVKVQIGKPYSEGGEDTIVV